MSQATVFMAFMALALHGVQVVAEAVPRAQPSLAIESAPGESPRTLTIRYSLANATDKTIHFCKQPGLSCLPMRWKTLDGYQAMISDPWRSPRSCAADQIISLSVGEQIAGRYSLSLPEKAIAEIAVTCEFEADPVTSNGDGNSWSGSVSADLTVVSAPGACSLA